MPARDINICIDTFANSASSFFIIHRFAFFLLILSKSTNDTFYLHCCCFLSVQFVYDETSIRTHVRCFNVRISAIRVSISLSLGKASFDISSVTFCNSCELTFMYNNIRGWLAADAGRYKFRGRRFRGGEFVAVFVSLLSSPRHWRFEDISSITGRKWRSQPGRSRWHVSSFRVAVLAKSGDLFSPTCSRVTSSSWHSYDHLIEPFYRLMKRCRRGRKRERKRVKRRCSGSL